MKYICITTFNNIRDLFVIFPEHVGHDDMAHSQGLKACDITSAGFVRFAQDDCGNTVYECYGRSVSLGVCSLETDSEKCNKQFFSWYQP